MLKINIVNLFMLIITMVKFIMEKLKMAQLVMVGCMQSLTTSIASCEICLRQQNPTQVRITPNLELPKW
jgi:hypothetical protein